jgi:hypothetical protein
MAPPTLNTISPELLTLIVDYLPLLYHYNLKLAGSRYIAGVVRSSATSRISRREYCQKICLEDAPHRRLPAGCMRKAIEITIERGQECLVRRYLKRYANPEGSEQRGSRTRGYLKSLSIAPHSTAAYPSHGFFCIEEMSDSDGAKRLLYMSLHDTVRPRLSHSSWTTAPKWTCSMIPAEHHCE